MSAACAENAATAKAATSGMRTAPKYSLFIIYSPIGNLPGTEDAEQTYATKAPLMVVYLYKALTATHNCTGTLLQPILAKDLLLACNKMRIGSALSAFAVFGAKQRQRARREPSFPAIMDKR